MDLTAEEERLREARRGIGWRRWGPYLSERQWGTVREDYSDNGDAWNYFTHDQARSRAYRWGEDGLAGISDDKGRLCFALALWNGADPILKERLFGLTNSEGNHGEDVKEYYFYVDSTPTHSWMSWRYKYPQAAYPYDDLVRTNRSRGRDEFEYELLDTGVFDGDRYFDVDVDYAKAGPDDLLVRITVHNRGPEDAVVHLLPTLWFRNTWAWATAPSHERPSLAAVAAPPGRVCVAATHGHLGTRYLHIQNPPIEDPPIESPHGAAPYDETDVPLLFCENETNAQRLWGEPNPTPFVKDGIGDAVVGGLTDAVNPDRVGTKCAAHVRLVVPAGGSVQLRARLSTEGPDDADPFADFDAVTGHRRREADEFYGVITPDGVGDDAALVLRQALAGMLWTKQYYSFDVDRWLREHQAHPLRLPKVRHMRNEQWFHMFNDDIISMPDKWEYPWYAAWDLAFHTIALTMVDPDFAKSQLDLMLSEPYLHPSGQIPAYEWNFGDVNPPVHAYATMFVYSLERHLAVDGGDHAASAGGEDVAFLREAFTKLLLNFTWWVNRKDRSGHNLFEGGFLGLDNIGVFDRSAPMPLGGHLEQADGTAWMALFSQNMLELALAMAEHDPSYEGFVVKFVQHFFWIAAAMDPIGEHPDEMWDEEDGFYYDVLRLPDGTGRRLKVRSLVGLLPLCATTVISAETLERFPAIREQVIGYLERNRDLLGQIHDPREVGVNGRRLLSVVNETKLRRILARMLDEERFLGPHGIRSLSKAHEREPYIFELDGYVATVAYEPAESRSGMFGGNSNWRGPVWFPVNLLILRALLQFYLFYGDSFRVECPTGSGNQMTLYEVAAEISRRLTSIFLRDPEGRRPVYGGMARFQEDPHWRDLILFHEYFHGDNGAGLGASHQTGWTGVVARLIQQFGGADAAQILHGSDRPMTVPYRRLADLSLGDLAAARRARGVREPQ